MRLRDTKHWLLAFSMIAAASPAETPRDRLLNSVSEPAPRARVPAQYQERRAAPEPQVAGRSGWGLDTRSYFTESRGSVAPSRPAAVWGGFYRPPNPYPDNPTPRIGGPNNGRDVSSASLGPVGSTFKPLDASAGAHLKDYKPTAESVADGQQAYKNAPVSTADGFQGYGDGGTTSVMQLGGELKTPTQLNLGLKVEGLSVSR